MFMSTPTTGIPSPQNSIQPNLPINLSHSLKISLSSPLRAENDIHFLESETFGFRDVVPDEGCAAEGEDAEDEVGPVGDAGDHVGCDLE
jgi:hypothetical protein